ncbi:hypothetical protein [Parvibacter caecicola]|uniref:Uncharacterized protein n=1 Tax=Parvibacter caecicola TaxID=747645 RepID=A0A7W5GPL3_9ACTN|nr:hypothetical protein [Parvibacter caecicola]MBB3171287.1 hypothetical protein [Parvibacter caecicola]MCR2041165.1 hypothetical protein [Parvibacter caecicola]
MRDALEATLHRIACPSTSGKQQRGKVLRFDPESPLPDKSRWAKISVGLATAFFFLESPVAGEDVRKIQGETPLWKAMVYGGKPPIDNLWDRHFAWLEV